MKVVHADSAEGRSNSRAGTSVTATESPIRLIIQQPSLAKYRVPVFRMLARRNGIELRVIHGSRPDLPNVPSDGFSAEEVPLRRAHVLGRPLFWHSPQWKSATPRCTDVLMLTWNVRYLSLVPALLRARARNVPTVLWGHGYSKNEVAWRASARNSVARLATALLFYGQRTAEEFIGRGWDERRIFVARNCLDQGPIQAAREAWLGEPARLNDFQTRERLVGGPVVLYVSRLEPHNRVDLLLEAIGRLAPQFPEIQAVIVGGGAGEKARLQALAAERQIAKRVRFLDAIYDERQLAPWFLAADVFCYPANIGLSLLHAFGYGLPVVTSDDLASQNPEIEALEHGVNGLLYQHGDAAALTDVLGRLLRDRDLRHRMGLAARRTATEQFTLARMVDGMEAAVRYAHGVVHGP